MPPCTVSAPKIHASPGQKKQPQFRVRPPQLQSCRVPTLDPATLQLQGYPANRTARPRNWSPLTPQLKSCTRIQERMQTREVLRKRAQQKPLRLVSKQC